MQILTRVFIFSIVFGLIGGMALFSAALSVHSMSAQLNVFRLVSSSIGLREADWVVIGYF